MMRWRCCLPGCKSNYCSERSNGYVSVFYFHKGERLKERWLKNIPRKDWSPTVNSVVCIKLFAESDIVRNVTFQDKNGSPKTCELNRPQLSPSATPRVFPSLPGYLNIAKTPESKDPEERRAESVSRPDTVLQDWLASYKIVNYEELLKSYKITSLVAFRKGAIIKLPLFVREGTATL